MFASLPLLRRVLSAANLPPWLDHALDTMFCTSCGHFVCWFLGHCRAFWRSPAGRWFHFCLLSLTLHLILLSSFCITISQGVSTELVEVGLTRFVLPSLPLTPSSWWVGGIHKSMVKKSPSTTTCASLHPTPSSGSLRHTFTATRLSILEICLCNMPCSAGVWAFLSHHVQALRSKVGQDVATRCIVHLPNTASSILTHLRRWCQLMEEHTNQMLQNHDDENLPSTLSVSSAPSV